MCIYIYTHTICIHPHPAVCCHHEMTRVIPVAPMRQVARRWTALCHFHRYLSSQPCSQHTAWMGCRYRGNWKIQCLDTKKHLGCAKISKMFWVLPLPPRKSSGKLPVSRTGEVRTFRCCLSFRHDGPWVARPWFQLPLAALPPPSADNKWAPAKREPRKRTGGNVPAKYGFHH